MAYDEPVADPAAYRRGGGPAADYRGRRRDTGEFPRPGARRVEEPLEPPGRPDDAGGEPARDRIGIHLGWEAILLLAVVGVAFLLYQLDPTSLRRPALDTLLVSATVIGLLTLGAGVTLRAGVPNLALGPIAVASALHFAENGDRGLLPAAGPAALAAAVGGLLVALVVVAFHVPGWAATLAGAMGVIVFSQLRTGPVAVQGTYEPTGQALLLFGGFAVLALAGGVLGIVLPVRRWLGRLRPVSDPAQRRGAGAALPVIGSLVLSSVFAAVAGVLLAGNSAGPIAPGTGLEWTGLAFGLALLAGTSAFGRRGGIFGTLLAVSGMALFLLYAERRDFDIALFAIAGSTMGAGLIITRLVETYGGRMPVTGVGEEDWQAATSGPANWSPDVPQTWSQAAPEPPGRWDDRWGTAGR
jgi:hypothetical protein